MLMAGLILGIIVVIILGIVVTVIDRKIKSKQDDVEGLKYKRDVRLTQNWPEYLSYTSKEKTIRLTKMVADISNMSKKDKDAIYSEYLEARKEALAKCHITLKGEIPTKEQKKYWNSMSIEQMIAEQTKIVSKENLTQLLQDIKEKEKELYALEMFKSNIIIIATVLQVCALFLATGGWQ